MARESKKREDEDSWLYILLLTTLNILIQSLKSYSFVIKGYMIGYGMLLLPWIFFLSNYISKRFGAKKAFASIAISAIICAGYTAMMSIVLGKNLYLASIFANLCGYVVSQIVNLFIYTFLLNNTKRNSFLVFVTYLFSIVVYYMFYTLTHLDAVIEDGYWEKYFITMIVEFLICIIVTMIDSRVKRRAK